MQLEIRSTLRRLSAAVRRHIWLFPALFVSVVVYATYLVTHSYPAFGAGLFLSIAEQISQHSYGLPAMIPSYTAGGIPFAYPPLAFYLVAALSDLLGVKLLVFSRILPGLFTILYLIPFYFLGATLLSFRWQAGLGALIVATAPPVLRWHISAGGFVRSLAMLFALFGLYTGSQLFEADDRRWVVPSSILFGLTILTHPLYTVFFGLSYLWMYLYFDRSPAGFLRGATVAAGGILLASPWWLQVLVTHSVDVFLNAAGTHGGVGKQLLTLITGLRTFDPTALFSLLPVAIFDFGSTVTAVTSVVFLLFAFTAVVLCWKGQFFLPVWFVLVVVLLEELRLTFLIGAFMTGAVIRTAIKRGALGTDPTDAGGGGIDQERRTILASFGAIGLTGMTLGTVYAGRGFRTYGGTTPSLPPFIDDADVIAMRWVQQNTPSSATFVVLGDVAEWFPYFTERTILIGPWGVEWRGHDDYRRQLRMFRRISACRRTKCLTNQLRQFGITPDYLYVPKGKYTVRSFTKRNPPAVRRSLVDSKHYRLVYENGGAMIFRVIPRKGSKPVGR